jgi:uncharacterized protein
MTWKFEPVRKGLPRLKKPILIEGLPGIGNVGKVAVDFIIEKVNATHLYDISSYTMPHSVFVNEDNLIELPSIELYYLKRAGKKPDLLLLTGDVQPIDEQSCYEFCDALLDMAEKFGVSEVITTGGIGLQEAPKSPKVYCTGADKAMIKRYCTETGASNKIYGVVGPIVGVSGILLGLANKRKIPAVTLLAETLGHPMYLGIKGGREVLKILNGKLDLGINLKDMDKEIKKLESEMLQKTKELSQISKETALKKIEGKFGKDMTYIG